MIGFTRIAVVDEISFRKATDINNSIAGNDGIQVYHYSMCQLMQTSLHLSWHLVSEIFKVKFSLVFNERDQNVKNESFCKKRWKESNWLLSCWWVLFSFNNVFDSMGCFNEFSVSKGVSISDWSGHSNVVVRRESSMIWDEIRYKKSPTVNDMWDCEWWRL